MNHPAPATDIARETARLSWARAATGDATFQLRRASTDAGFRSYWRGDTAEGSRIVMDSPPDKEDVRPWLRIRDLLERGGVRTPQVKAQDAESGFLLLEDLGRQTYLDVLTADNANALLDAAVAQLLKLQTIACPADLPAYDEALLMRELRLFDEWFLRRHLGVQLTGDEIHQLEAIYACLTRAALDQPQVLVHRDYMPRNLMPLPGPAELGPAVLDFQDAVRGPVAYDPVSLFKDAFLSWPPERVEAWLSRYHARARAAGIPVPALSRFRHDADLIGMQRHLKVIGIFARLCHRDSKPKYIADVPRFIAYLDEALPRHPELAPLQDLIDQHVRPRLGDDHPA